MQWLQNLWKTLRSWYAPAPQSALSVMQELKREKRNAHPDWAPLTRRFQTLVFSEADRQRLWKRAHRGDDEAPRLFSGIVAPTPNEIKHLEELVSKLESAR